MSSDSAFDSYRRRAEQLLSDVEFGARRLCAATDAEILALDGPDAKRITPLLSFGPEVSDEQRAAAVDEAASRMLRHRAIADGTPLGGEDAHRAHDTYGVADVAFVASPARARPADGTG